MEMAWRYVMSEMELIKLIWWSTDVALSLDLLSISSSFVLFLDVDMWNNGKIRCWNWRQRAKKTRDKGIANVIYGQCWHCWISVFFAFRLKQDKTKARVCIQTITSYKMSHQSINLFSMETCLLTNLFEWKLFLIVPSYWFLGKDWRLISILCPKVLSELFLFKIFFGVHLL